MGAIFQGLRMVYEENGHITRWNVDSEGTAQGNPLIGNRDISLLRRAHHIHLARNGSMSIKARPITGALICDLAAKFWYQGDDLDILLHSIDLDLTRSVNLTSTFRVLTQKVLVLRLVLKSRTRLLSENTKLMTGRCDSSSWVAIYRSIYRIAFIDNCPSSRLRLSIL